jgi:hypothetical protein
MVFERFAALGNARAVLRHFVDNGLGFPRLVQAGPDKGQVVWVRPTYGMIQRMLNNPAYAGAFVYGRCRQDTRAGDPPTTTERRLPPEEWGVVVQQVYPAYTSYETFLRNHGQLRANLYNFASKGAARPGRERRCCKDWCIAGDADVKWGSVMAINSRATSVDTPSSITLMPCANRF